ncbi:alcohol dehydrogenase catalytic domain-containing protein, partial [Myxococcota bacterium]
MRAWLVGEPVQGSPLPFSFTERPEPVPGPGQVRVKVRACGVCHTDLHMADGELRPSRLPRVPGHQVVGEVDQVGAGVDLPLGSRVGVPWLHRACEACEFCARGEENLCPQAQFTGLDVDGGYAQWTLAQAAYVIPLPDGIAASDQAPLLCAGIIGYRSLRRARVESGERVGLFGFGASAHLALQILRHWDCEVFAFTRSQGHRRHALALGANWAG